MERMLFIYNPKAGKGAVRSQLSNILEELGKHDYHIVIHPTREAQDAARIVQERGCGYDLIVCSGGDGTLDEVVTGMQRGGFQRPLGYIPAGSTNDFANSLGLPKNMRSAAKVVAEGKEFLCDLGKMNEDYFVYVAAFGVFTDVSYKTSQEWKNMLGHLAYILEGVKSLSNLKSWKMRYESQEQSGSGEFLYGMITNSNSVGGFKGITGKDVTLNDGMFEVTLILMPDNFIEWPGIINALMTGEKNRFVISFKTSRVEFISETPVSWTRDGEYGGTHRRALIENIPRALPIIVPDVAQAATVQDALKAEDLAQDEAMELPNAGSRSLYTIARTIEKEKRRGGAD